MPSRHRKLHKGERARLCGVAVAVIAVSILAAHLVVSSPSLWTENTIGELASQGYGSGSIMRLGFIAFSVIITVGGGTRAARNPRLKWPQPAVSV